VCRFLLFLPSFFLSQFYLAPGFILSVNSVNMTFLDGVVWCGVGLGGVLAFN
jgi:hypothetical protein